MLSYTHKYQHRKNQIFYFLLQKHYNRPLLSLDFQENYYSNVIVSGNKTLDNGKMKDMLTKYSVLPDKLFNYETTDDTYTLQHWHENFAIYREECGKDKKTSKLFIPFNFND